MEVTRKILIMNKKGIHARTAAMIVSFVNNIRNKYNVKTYIKKDKTNIKIPISSMLALTSLRIKQGETIIISCIGEKCESALDEIENYISGQIDQKMDDIEELDKVLEENTINITSELESIKEIKDKFGSILNHINDGICLMDNKGIITYVNTAYEKIFKTRAEDIIGKNVKNVYPNRPSIKALDENINILNVVMDENNDKQIISNSNSIFANGVFKGVLTTYKDVTDLRKMMYNLDKAREKIKYYEEELDKKNNVHEAFNFIIGKSSLLKEAIAMAFKAAKTSATVMIRGESGTGKELVAKAIHEASKRKKGPFIKVNCAAIPENLLESELFGYEKGAFTGALKRKIGKFELANEGTIFLDEIGEINYNLQAKLLRAIQEKEIERLGGNTPIKTDIRIIAATNRNLEEMVSDNIFREDLYYRLNVIPIILPPLRNRKGDIPLLVEHFIEKICNEENIPVKNISNEALKYLEEYSWPGNIRELENLIMRAIALSEEEIDINSFPTFIKSISKNKNLINLKGNDLATMEEYDREIIKLALEKHKSFNKAAKALGLTHRTISLKAKKYNL
ncbi:sigma 54-interacting transcriptional regulator [Tepidibacter formicigenes]|jgi:phosphotransferase system HPr (HPr) family protein|uniref:HTH-type transcriptional regulatory protein TyrR n=1 Tax=Tepidibacter formicigenes DSM 15518 TaxID=1123349 RepID=A0A1M6KJ64_9FIRM|nr:sigma 54-interacting transcriptional regulator [Tepidibacter formicigenes]SHJ58993.1 phosphotransferase system HPr (HPr) family [Tepidibacter formicigenes DSM 15518]